MAVIIGTQKTSGDGTGTRYNSARESNNVAAKITIGPEKSPGWLLRTGVYAGGRGGSVGARMAVWNDDVEAGAERLWMSSQQVWGNQLFWRTGNLTTPLRLPNNTSYWVGFWTDNSRYGDQYRVDYNISDNPSNRGFKESGSLGPATNYRNYQPGDPAGALVCYMFYEPNDDPGIGSWAAPTTNTGGGVPIVNTSQPTFSGYTPHPLDSQYDFTEAVHLQVWRPDTGQVLHEETFETTNFERQARYFSHQSTVLPTGIEIRAKFRHRDSWGVWSDWSSTIRFACARGPLPPQITSPRGRINAVSSYSYEGVYEHDIGLVSNAMRIQVLNETGTQVIHDSGTIFKTVLHDTPWTEPVFHNPLSWGGKYRVQVQFRSRNQTNTADVWGPWSQVAFEVNAPPNKPTELTPSGNRDTGERDLSAKVTDPTGDIIVTARIELFNETTGTMVGGYPKIVETIAGGTLTHNAGPDMQIDNAYRWRAQASDGYVYGEWSDWASFTFRAAPVVAYTHPTLAGLRNRVDDPSAEYDTGTYWTEQNRVESGANLLSPNQAGVETDLSGIAAYVGQGTLPALARITSDSIEGSASARITAAAGGSTDPGLVTTISAQHPLRPSLSVMVAQAMVKGPAGAQVACRTVAYDDDGVVLSYGPPRVMEASGEWEPIESSPHVVEAEHKAGINVYLVGERDPGDILLVDQMIVAEPVGGDPVSWIEGTYGSVGYAQITFEGEEAYGDAASGMRSWRAVEGYYNEHHFVGQPEDIDASAPGLYYGYFKKERGLANTIFRVDCYDSSDAFVGSVYPKSLAEASGVDVKTYWSPYGGIIWPAGHANATRYPDGTARTRIVIYPSHMSEAIVLFDAIARYEVPLFPESEWPEAERWYGYSDGDAEEYGDVPGDLAYSWAGTPGDSDSFGPPVARMGPLSVHISYAHQTGKPKAADRVVLYRAVGGTYVGVHDSGWQLSNRTKIPLPNAQIKSEARYRLVVSVRDSIGIVTEMPQLLFDVRFEGPQELNIYVARAQPETAEVHLGFEQTTLGVNQFGGIEVAVGEDREVVALITDPRATAYVYPFPLSGEETEYWVRQIENRGEDQIESRWDHVSVYMEYDRWWLKDVEDPYSVALPVKVYSSDEPSLEHTAPIQKYTPWGEDEAVHIVGRTRETSGTLVVRLLESDPDLGTKVAAMEEVKKRRKVMCLLSQRPPEKRFVMITSITQTPSHVPFYAVYELEYEVSRYSESYYERAGIFQS